MRFIIPVESSIYQEVLTRAPCLLKPFYMQNVYATDYVCLCPTSKTLLAC